MVWINTDYNRLLSHHYYSDATVRSINTQIIALDEVAAKARTHFACTTLAGLELENQASILDQHAYWDRRTMGNEVIL